MRASAGCEAPIGSGPQGPGVYPPRRSDQDGTSSCARPSPVRKPPGMETVGARLGVLGGTFDPIHRGHLAMARAARAAHGLPLVLLVPAATPPHKRGDLTAVEHRLAMARIAATGEKGIEVSDIEVRRGGISYTVDTLAELAGDRPRVELFFVIGEDTIPELPYWKDAARILALARVVAVNRPGHHRSFEAALF